MPQTEMQYRLKDRLASDPRTSPYVELIAEILCERVKELPTNFQKATVFYRLEECLFNEVSNSRYILPNPDTILKIGIALVARFLIGTDSEEPSLKRFPPIRKLAEDRLWNTIMTYRHVIPNYYLAAMQVNGKYMMTPEEASKPNAEPLGFFSLLPDFPEASGFERGIGGSPPLNPNFYRDSERVLRASIESIPHDVLLKIRKCNQDVINVKIIDCMDEQKMKEYRPTLSKFFDSIRILDKEIPKNPTSYLSLYLLLHRLHNGDARKIIESYVPPMEELNKMPKLFDVTNPLYA